MADGTQREQTKSPRARIDTSPAGGSDVFGRGHGAAPAAAAGGSGRGEGTGDAAGGGAVRQPGEPTAVSAWLTRHFPGHEHAVVGACCGLLAALLVFAIGFFQTLFIAILVAVGTAIGSFFDGDPRIVGIIRRLLSERRK